MSYAFLETRCVRLLHIPQAHCSTRKLLTQYMYFSHSPVIPIRRPPKSSKPATPYFLPFFFFFPPPPPPPPAAPPCGVCASVGVCSPGVSPAASASCIVSSGTSCTPAMALPRRPMAAYIRRVTSAAFVVRYLSVTPLTGSYVLSTRLPRGGLSEEGVAADSSAELVLSDGLRGLTALMEYLVVTRVYRYAHHTLAGGLFGV